MIIHLSKEGFKHIRKYLFWIVALVAITIYVFYNVFPEEFPNYQNKLFTVKSNSLITVNWIALIFCVIFSVRQLDRYRKTQIISNLIMLYLNIMYYLPGLLMCMIYETDEIYNSYYIIFWFAFTIFHYIMIRIYNTKNKVARNSKKHQHLRVDGLYYARFRYFALGYVLLILAISFMYSGMKINISTLLNQEKVLEIREAAAEENIHWIIWNLVVAGSMIFPVWFTLAHKQGLRKYMILLVVTICAMYTIAASRIYLFLLFFSFVISFFKDDELLIAKGWILIMIVIILEHKVLNIAVVSNVYRRLCLTPNGESRFYIDYFLKHKPDLARQVLERWARLFGVESEYVLRIPTMIGKEYLGGSNCNTGLIGSSFGNYGKIGLFWGPVLYTFSFWLLNRITNKIRYKKSLQCLSIVIAIMVTNTFGWTEYLLLPSFLLVFYMIVLIMPPIEENNIIEIGLFL